jgi:hypothetical protein
VPLLFHFRFLSAARPLRYGEKRPASAVPGGNPGLALYVDFSSLFVSPARCEWATPPNGKTHDLGFLAEFEHKILCSAKASYAIHLALSKDFFSLYFSIDCMWIFVTHARFGAGR